MEISDMSPYNQEDLDQMLQEAVEEALSTELAPWDDGMVGQMLRQTRQLMDTVIEYKELMMMYACAMKTVQTKFDVLNTEFKVRYQRNPISSISTRLKRTASITEKLSRQNLPFSLENISDHVHDVAGVRVICSYIDDIYTIADALLRQDDVTLVARKDYIAAPKPNGYRSLHLIISVPVFFADQKKEMKVEVQIRTIAMDFWASLEHQLKYKQEIPNQREIIDQLQKCAQVINATDEKMLSIRRQIEDLADTPTEEDILLEKISRLDLAVDM